MNAQENLSTARNNLTAVQGRVGVGQLPIETLIANAVGAALSFAGMIFLLFMIYAGYLWFTARGDDEQTKKAMGIIKTTIVGLILLLSAGAITFFITTRLQTGGTTTGLYNDSACNAKPGWSCGDVGACVQRHDSESYNTIMTPVAGDTPEMKLEVLLTSGCNSDWCQKGLCLGSAGSNEKQRVCCKN